MAPFIVEQSRTQRFGNDFERRECALSDTTKVQERNDEAGDDKTMVWYNANTDADVHRSVAKGI
jgi:hypothetical protein